MLNLKNIASKMALLTVGDPKTRKNIEKGYLTGILYLSPGDSSGYEVCPHASPGCRAVCLAEHSGHAAINKNVREARIRRTKMFFERREMFFDLLVSDLHRLRYLAAEEGLKLAIRLNGGSDILWEREFPTLFIRFRDVAFYDYTKILTRLVGEDMPLNLHLTGSLSEINEGKIRGLINIGYQGNFSMVGAGEMPDCFMGRRVIAGDEHDLRLPDFDGMNKFVWLTPKGGKAKVDTSGFVRRLEMAT